MNWLVTTFAWLSCSAALGSEPAAVPGREGEAYAQAWLGALETDEGWSLKQPGSDQSLVGDLGTLPFGGGAAQRVKGP